MLGAVHQDLAATHASLQQHLPEVWEASVLMPGLLPTVWWPGAGGGAVFCAADACVYGD
jgi:hypothetical protein